MTTVTVSFYGPSIAAWAGIAWGIAASLVCWAGRVWLGWDSWWTGLASTVVVLPVAFVVQWAIESALGDSE